MEDFDLFHVAERATKGFLALTSRTLFIQILTVVVGFFLTILFKPEVYGEYYIASSFIAILNYFQDVGLAASLIQKKEQPTIEELRTTFTTQQVLVLFLIIPAFFFSGFIAHFYHLDQSGIYLLYALLISFFMSSLKTIPTVLLERNLRFEKLIIPEIIEAVSFNVTLIIFALLGFGITSFTLAVLVRSITGLFAIYYIQPWEIGISFQLSNFKKLISFGVPFQANSILALVKDNLLVLFIGKVLPLNQVGYIGFAEKLAFLPLRLIMDNIIKITFPAYSRMQHDKQALKVMVEKSLFLISFFIFPIATSIALFSHEFIHYIPIEKFHKWEPAVIAIGFYSLNAVLASLTVPLTNFLNAIGRVKETLYFMILLTIFAWVITPLFIKLYGFNGVAAASAIVAGSLLFITSVVKKHIEFSLIQPVIKQFIAVGIMTIWILLTRQLITSFPLFVMDGVLSIVIYGVLIYTLAKKELNNTLLFLTKKSNNS